MTIFDRDGFRQTWKADTPGNYYVNGDAVSPEFGDEVMYRSDVGSPGGDQTQSVLTVNLPAITSSAVGRQIKVACVYANGGYAFYGAYNNSVAGQVLLRPSSADLIQDTFDYIQPYGPPYTDMQAAYFHRNGDPGGDGNIIDQSFSPQSGPYVITLTAMPASSDDVYADGRWKLETASIAPPVNAAAQSMFYKTRRNFTATDLTAAAETQEFGLLGSGLQPTVDAVLIGVRIHVKTGMSLVGTNVSARWAASTAALAVGADAGLLGKLSSSFPGYGGFSLHLSNNLIVVGPVSPGQVQATDAGAGPVIEFGTNGGGNLSTVGAFDCDVDTLWLESSRARDRDSS